MEQGAGLWHGYASAGRFHQPGGEKTKGLMSTNAFYEQVLKRKAFLVRIPLFQGMSESSLLALAGESNFTRFNRGQFVFFQEDLSDAAFIVRFGKISIILESLDGRQLVINEMNPGELFGEIGVITRHPRSSSAIARTDSELLVIPGDILTQILDFEPSVVRRMLSMASDRLRASTERESALAFLDAQGRLARLLLQLSCQDLDKGYITISQEELAQRTGQTRQTVAKTLGRWRRSGWLITGRGRIMLLKTSELTQLEKK
jgi:CRP/FNR family transcriptional regulator, cyclic AMP receptor protein